jgi:hypothetical protein
LFVFMYNALPNVINNIHLGYHGLDGLINYLLYHQVDRTKPFDLSMYRLEYEKAVIPPTRKDLVVGTEYFNIEDIVK